jgi:hypothetical protein
MAPRKRAFVVARAGDTRNSAKPEAFLLTMIDRDLETRGGAHHYSRWPEPWRPEDDWGPISAAVIFFHYLVCADRLRQWRLPLEVNGDPRLA